jgi:hypothetical protein
MSNENDETFRVVSDPIAGSVLLIVIQGSLAPPRLFRLSRLPIFGSSIHFPFLIVGGDVTNL